MMTLLRLMRFLLLLIPVIAAASRFPQRRSAPIDSTPSYDSDDYEVTEFEDHESEYSTTEFPYFVYQTTSSFEEESTEEETTIGITEETVTAIDDLADAHVKSIKAVDPLNKTLSELFYENHPVEKFDFERCKARGRDGDLSQHYAYRQQNVYFSAPDPNNLRADRVKRKAFTWQEARDLCRSNCKELLTLDSLDKAFLISSIIKSDGILGIWTSGRRCDFPGCRDRDDVQEDGWFWSTSGHVIHTSYKPGSQDKQPYQWDKTDPVRPQPDNAEFVTRGVNESCLALRFGVDENKLKLHDLPCHSKLHIVCEEPLELQLGETPL